MLTIVTHASAGPVETVPLVIAHGLFGSARNWNVVARNLAVGRDVHVVDMRNHGTSPRQPTQSYADMAGDLAEVVRPMGQADLLGHSMGGKAAMVLALTEGALLRRVVVGDIAPVTYAHDQSQHIVAMRGLDLTGLTSRAEADRRLALTVPDPALRAFFLQSLDVRAEPPVWRLNLNVLQDQMPLIVGWPPVTGQFDGPVLFLTGSDSHYVRPEHHATIRALFPRARFVQLTGAGHWLHADRPREFEATVRAYLAA